MASEKGEEPTTEDFPTHKLQLTTGRIKKIMKLDKEISKVNSEALFLVSYCTEIFIQFLADKSARVSIEKKKKTIKLDHLRVAVKRHQPTGDFLLDSLPPPPQPSDQPPNSDKKPFPAGTRRIDAFFTKCS